MSSNNFGNVGDRLNDQCGSPWIYTLRPVGRGIFVEGSPVEIRAWDLRHAIKLARKRISRAWSLRLIAIKRPVE